MVGARVDEEAENVFKVSSRISSTWGGKLTDMVRCNRFLEIIVAENLVDDARRIGEWLLEELVALQGELGGLVANARGRGLMIAFDLPTPELRNKAVASLVEHGMLLLRCGVRSIRFRPPLNLSMSEAGTALEIVRESLKGLWRSGRPSRPCVWERHRRGRDGRRHGEVDEETELAGLC